jgi:hypothetical protein
VYVGRIGRLPSIAAAIRGRRADERSSRTPKLSIGGLFTSIGGQTRHNIGAVKLTTGAATSWDPDPNNTVRVLALGPDGSVWVGGDFTGFPSAQQSSIARFKP